MSTPTVQPSFIALSRQHLRQSWHMYLCGFAGSLFSGFLIFFSSLPPAVRQPIEETELLFGITFSAIDDWLMWLFVFLMMAFTCTIFSADRHCDSGNSPTRCGLPAGKFWWSRMLPAMLAMLPMLLTGLGLLVHCVWVDPDAGTIEDVLFPCCFFAGIWLLLIGCGAVSSIYIRQPLAAIAVGTVMMLCLFFGILTQANHFGETLACCTVISLALTLLLGSRLRAACLLREQFTWKSRLLPLMPFIMTFLLSLAAVPPYRVYSVALIPIETVEQCVAAANLPERLPPEKLHTLLTYLDEHDAAPPDYLPRLWYNQGYLRCGHCADPANPSKEFMQELHTILQSYRKVAAAMPTLDEYVLFYDMYLQEQAKRELRDMSVFDIDGIAKRIRCYAPWEQERRKRLRHVNLIQTAKDIQRYNSGEMYQQGENIGAMIGAHLYSMPDIDHWSGKCAMECYEECVVRERLEMVYLALYCYYLEHHQTLPKDLDELTGTYIDKVPVHPFTQVPMQWGDGRTLSFMHPKSDTTWQIRSLDFLFSPNEAQQFAEGTFGEIIYPRPY